MELAWRMGGAKDFEGFYRTFYTHCLENVVLHRIMSHEWAVMTANDAAITVVVEDGDRPEGHRMIACAQAVFVTDTFAAWARTNMPPWPNMHATRWMPNGTSPLLDARQVGRGNATDGSCALVAHWDWSEDIAGEEEGRRVRDYLYNAFAFCARGNRLKDILIGVVGDQAKQMAINTGFRLLNDYTDYYRGQAMPAPEERPYLLGITREQAIRVEGSSISHSFVHTPPRCHFGPGERALLFLALMGKSDDDAARELYLTPVAVKKRWQGIYGRVDKALPGLLPATPDGVRGAEKRRLLLQYLREHPEELRPFERPRVAQPRVKARS